VKRILIIFLVVLGLLQISVYCADQLAEKEIKTVTGDIGRVDWVVSIITVKLLDPVRNYYDEIIISVPDGAKITRGSENINLSDIEISDEVAVDYYDDPAGGLKAISIRDLNEGNE